MIPFLLICVLVLSVSRYHDVSFLYLSRGCDPLCYIAYPFVHASFTHLLVNTITILSFWERLDRESTKAFLMSLLLSYPVVTAIGISDTPTVGASGIAFTIVGTYLSMLLRDHGIKTFIRFFLLVSAIMIAQAFLSRGSVNWMIHASSLYLSTILSCLYMEWTKRRS